MKLKRKILCAAIAGSLTLASSAHARNFSNLYVFGDSLSDAGAYAGLLTIPASVAKFTTNPDNVWAQNLGASYNLAVSSAYNTSLAGFAANGTGNDFAVGGARAALAPGYLTGALTPFAPLVPSVSDQVSSLLSRGALDSNALYAVWAGANDVFTQLDAVNALTIAPATAMANLQTAAAAEAGELARLRAAGAKNVIVIGLPDIGATPFGASIGTTGAATLTAMSSAYNDALKAAIAGGGVLYFDSAAILNAVLADPARFGLTNTTTPACGLNPSLGCIPGTTLGTVSAANAIAYVFADGVHPGGTTHALLSDWIRSTLETTGRMSLLSSVPMGRSGAQWRAMNERMREFQNFSYQGQGIFVTGDHAPARLDATADTPSAKGATNSFTLGYEKAFADDVFGGVAIGYERTPFDLGNNGGTVTYEEWALSGFISRKFGKLYANATATAAFLDYSTSRNTLLGPTTYTDTGSTHGRQTALKAQLGYNFSQGNYVHGPVAGIAWEEVRVSGYQEAGSNFTAMQFGDQTRRQLRSSVGWQIEGSSELWGMNFRPHAQLDYAYQHLADNREYSVGFVGTGTSMSVPSENRQGGYGLITVGGIVSPSKTLSIGVNASTTVGESGADNFSVSLSLASHF